MATKPNPTVGHCPCRIAGCGLTADIRRQKGHERGALYVHCPEHGVIRLRGQAEQARLAAYLDGAQAPAPEHEPAPAPEHEPAPAPAPAPEHEPAPAPEAKRETAGSWLEW